MFDYGPYVIGVLLNIVIFANSERFYSVVAPGVIKSNHNYTVVVSLHEAPAPSTISIRIQGAGNFQMENEVYLKPYGTKTVVFEVQTLVKGDHKLMVEGKGGFSFRNETLLVTRADAGPKMYIQTDKAIYKPGDEVQFQVFMLDVHTRPLKIEEPIRVDIFDGAQNRVRQFKDIALVKGIHKNKFQLSKNPVMGTWEIRVSISGRFGNTESKMIQIEKYVLPKFSVYIETDDVFVRNSGVLKARVYGKYTFEKYVEGNMTAKLTGISRKNQETIEYKEKNFDIKDMQTLVFPIETPSNLEELVDLRLEIELMEKHTAITRNETKSIKIVDAPYRISVDTNTIDFRKGIPYRLKAHVAYWHGPPVLDHNTAVTMKHGPNEYEAFLDDNGDATFEFEHARNQHHDIQFQNATYFLGSIFAEKDHHNDAVEYCKLTLKGERLRLGTPVEIEVTSIENIPYLIYTIVGHANIIHTDHIVISPNQKSYTIQITPSIEMVPYAFVYVYYIQNGNLRYDEIQLKFPFEFENKISVSAPKQVKPGQEVTLELKAEPKSYVGILAVDLGVYLLDPTYDLQRNKILEDLQNDISTLTWPAQIYPGISSGVVTLTNAYYKHVELDGIYKNENGLKFLNNDIDKIDNIYALSVMAATLTMAKDSNAERVLQKLALRQHMSDEHIWWTESDQNREKDVEITSYIFMALLDHNNDPKNDLRILKWLLEQRNERGGFKSTHDTVVGLQALVKSSQKYKNEDNINVNIKYVAKNNEGNILKTGTLNVDQNNALLLQTEEFPKQTRSIDIEASGVGEALLQLSYQYHQVPADEFKHFKMKAQAKMLNDLEMELDVCFTYKPVLPSNVTTTNMVIMKTNLLSGFKSSDEHKNDLRNNYEIVQRVELENGDTTVVIYIDNIAVNVENCIKIASDKYQDVAMRKRATIVMYDYYKRHRYDSMVYNI